MIHQLIRAVPVLGRILLGSLFVLGGMNKILTFSETAQRMADVGLTPAEPLLVLTISLELIAGSLVVLGARFAAVAALLLALFTLATNFYFHRFWEFEGPLRVLELSLYFKNVSISGGLLVLAGYSLEVHKSGRFQS